MGKGVSNDSSSVMTLRPHAYNATEFSVGLTTDAPSAMSSLPSRGTFLKWFVFSFYQTPKFLRQHFAFETRNLFPLWIQDCSILIFFG